MNAEENSGNVCFVGYMATRLPVGGREGKGDSNKHWKYKSNDMHLVGTLTMRLEIFVLKFIQYVSLVS